MALSVEVVFPHLGYTKNYETKEHSIHYRCDRFCGFIERHGIFRLPYDIDIRTGCGSDYE